MHAVKLAHTPQLGVELSGILRSFHQPLPRNIIGPPFLRFSKSKPTRSEPHPPPRKPDGPIFFSPNTQFAFSASDYTTNVVVVFLNMSSSFVCLRTPSASKYPIYAHSSNGRAQPSWNHVTHTPAIHPRSQAQPYQVFSWSMVQPRPVNGVLRVAPVALSARRPFIPVFDSPTRVRPFHAALPPTRREAYDHTARLLLVSALLAEHHRAAHALWTAGIPVGHADATPCRLSRDPESTRKWEGNPEQAWYNAIEARLCLAVLDLVIIAAAYPSSIGPVDPGDSTTTTS
ncbi:hypothetical protein FB451DRAFT_1388653 [Mycena latifolia]|nr:hypothetical protein FB451DRAFT_1388653 [Mycena latifolia]